MNRFFSGFCIGAADLVPGISGGTVALLLGIYDELIGSLCRFRKESLIFLVPILLGMGTAILTLSPLLHMILESESGKTALYLFFFGLVGGSVHVCFRRYPASTMASKGTFVLGTLIAGALVLLQMPTLLAEAGPTLGFFYPYMAVAGALAVGAMLLPGISGSYLLVTIGTYPLIIKSLTFDSETALPILISFGIGVIFGAITFTPLIQWGLKRYSGPAHTLLIGFMLGSMPALLTAWQPLFLPLAILGYVLVLFLENMIYISACKTLRVRVGRIFSQTL